MKRMYLQKYLATLLVASCMTCSLNWDICFATEPKQNVDETSSVDNERVEEPELSADKSEQNTEETSVDKEFVEKSDLSTDELEKNIEEISIDKEFLEEPILTTEDKQEQNVVENSIDDANAEELTLSADNQSVESIESIEKKSQKDNSERNLKIAAIVAGGVVASLRCLEKKISIDSVQIANDQIANDQILFTSPQKEADMTIQTLKRSIRTKGVNPEDVSNYLWNHCDYSITHPSNKPQNTLENLNLILKNASNNTTSIGLWTALNKTPKEEVCKLFPAHEIEFKNFQTDNNDVATALQKLVNFMKGPYSLCNELCGSLSFIMGPEQAEKVCKAYDVNSRSSRYERCQDKQLLRLDKLDQSVQLAVTSYMQSFYSCLAPTKYSELFMKDGHVDKDELQKKAIVCARKHLSSQNMNLSYYTETIKNTSFTDIFKELGFERSRIFHRLKAWGTNKKSKNSENNNLKDKLAKQLLNYCKNNPAYGHCTEINAYNEILKIANKKDKK